MPVFQTACPRNCYSTCTMKVQVYHGKLRMIEPDPGNLATHEGVCLKGLSYIERVYSPDRILDPLKKTGKGGRFVKIDWDTAYEMIIHKLKPLRERVGPQSILYYTGSGTKGLLNEIGMNFWKWYGGCTTTYGDLCWPAGLEASRLTLGDNKHNAPWDIARARLIILWGKNPAETNIHQMYYINQALANGARLIVIDPRRTETAELADIHLQVKPAGDAWLLAAMFAVIVQEGLLDEPWVAAHTEGLDAVRPHFEALPVADYCERAGVEEALARKAARRIAQASSTAMSR